jgi:glycosyltransferase involved in cell wall biosynthesis
MTTTVVQLVATLRDGGAEALLRGLLPVLAARPGIDLHVVSVYDPRLDGAERAALGAPLHEIGRRERRDIGFAPRLVSTLRRLRPDIVHAHLHTGKYAGRIASIAAGVPAIVFTEHGDEAGGILRGGIKRLLNTRTARFIVFTEAERQRYAREEGIPTANIAVIANGIPPPPPTDIPATRAELGLEEGQLAIALPARLVHQKNQELALRALALLRSGGRTDLRLFIIGDGADGAALRALAAELHLGTAVTFLGYRTDAIRLTAACDLMALASRWEKMPLVLGEAMLAGVPVVSTPWTGVDSFIEDERSGIIARDWTPQAFAAALDKAIESPARRAALAAGGRLAAGERFDLDRAVDAHVRLYADVRAK